MKKLLFFFMAFLICLTLAAQDYQVQRGNRAFIKEGDTLCIIIGADTTVIRATNVLVIGGNTSIIMSNDLFVPNLNIGDSLLFDDGTYMITVPTNVDTSGIALQVGYLGHCVNAWLNNVYGCSPVKFYTTTHAGTNNIIEAYNDISVLLFALSDIGNLKVNGSVKVGAEVRTPAAGVIQWTGTSFKGFNGTVWYNLGIPNGTVYGDLPIWDSYESRWRASSNINFRDTERRLSMGASPYFNTLLSLRSVNSGNTSSFLQGEDAMGVLRIRITDEGDIITSGYGDFNRLLVNGSAHTGAVKLLDLRNDMNTVFSVNDLGAAETKGINADGDINVTGAYKTDGFTGVTGNITVLCDVRINAGQLQKKELVLGFRGGIITHTIESIWLNADVIP